MEFVHESIESKPETDNGKFWREYSVFVHTPGTYSMHILIVCRVRCQFKWRYAVNVFEMYV